MSYAFRAPFASSDAIDSQIETGGGSVDNTALRALVRSNFPMLAGAVAANMTKQQCYDVLTGKDSPAAIRSQVMAKLGQVAAAPPLPGEASSMMAAVVSHPVPSGGNIMQQVQVMAQQLADMQLAQAKTEWDAEKIKLLEAVEEAKAASQIIASTPKIVPVQPGTTVRIGNTDFESVGGLSDPKLAGYVPVSDPMFNTNAWRSLIRCGAVNVKNTFEDLAKLLVNGKTILLVGERGCGKTTAIEQLCAALQWPLTKVLFNKDIDNDILVGSKEAANGATFFVPGPLAKAMEDGHVFLADEVFRASPECTNILHTVMEKNATGRLTLVSDGGRVITPHPNFRFVATDNTFGYGDMSGRYVDCRVQDAAFLDRLTAKMGVEYPAPGLEASIVSAKGGITNKIASLMVKLANDTRKALSKDELNGAISTRALINWATLTRETDLTTAFALTIITSLNPADQPVVVEMAQRHFGADLKLSPANAMPETEGESEADDK